MPVDTLKLVSLSNVNDLNLVHRNNWKSNKIYLNSLGLNLPKDAFSSPSITLCLPLGIMDFPPSLHLHHTLVPTSHEAPPVDVCSFGLIMGLRLFLSFQLRSPVYNYDGDPLHLCCIQDSVPPCLIP